MHTRPAVHVMREQLGLSKAELARVLGVSQSLVSRWEAGTRKIPDKTLETLSRMVVHAIHRRVWQPFDQAEYHHDMLRRFLERYYSWLVTKALRNAPTPDIEYVAELLRQNLISANPSEALEIDLDGLHAAIDEALVDPLTVHGKGTRKGHPVPFSRKLGLPYFINRAKILSRRLYLISSRESDDNAPEAVDDHGDNQAELFTEDMRELLRRAKDDLTPLQQEIINLKYFGDKELSVQDVRRNLKMPEISDKKVTAELKIAIELLKKDVPVLQRAIETGLDYVSWDDDPNRCGFSDVPAIPYPRQKYTVVTPGKRSQDPDIASIRAVIGWRSVSNRAWIGWRETTKPRRPTGPRYAIGWKKPKPKPPKAFKESWEKLRAAIASGWSKTLKPFFPLPEPPPDKTDNSPITDFSDLWHAGPPLEYIECKELQDEMDGVYGKAEMPIGPIHFSERARHRMMAGCVFVGR